MKKNNFEYDFLVFLYAYLRQLDLSLDRSRWTSFEELRKYYQNQIDPALISRCLLNKSGLSIQDNNVHYTIEKKNYLDRVKYKFKKQYYLTENEIYYCCKNLLKLSNYLFAHQKVEKIELEKLRIDLTKFTYDILEFRILDRDVKKAMKIEHYLESNPTDVKIKDFIKGFDLE